MHGCVSEESPSLIVTLPILLMGVPVCCDVSTIVRCCVVRSYRRAVKIVPLPVTKTSALPSSAVPGKTPGTEIVGAPPTKKLCVSEFGDAAPAPGASSSTGTSESAPASITPAAAPASAKPAAAKAEAAAAKPEAAAADKKSKKKEKAAKSGGAEGGKKQQEAAEVDFSRLNVRVGKIMSVRRHPDADGLYVEEGMLFVVFQAVCTTVGMCEFSLLYAFTAPNQPQCSRVRVLDRDRQAGRYRAQDV